MEPEEEDPVAAGHAGGSAGGHRPHRRHRRARHGHRHPGVCGQEGEATPTKLSWPMGNEDPVFYCLGFALGMLWILLKDNKKMKEDTMC